MSIAPQYVVDDEGNRTAVILKIADYEEMMEDLADLAAIADRREEPTISHEKFVQDLKDDGFLPS